MNKPHFNGSDYKPESDLERLGRQHEAIRDLMLDGKWRSLQEIAFATGYQTASISAQLRHLRKVRFGGHLVEKCPRRPRISGYFEYRVTKGESNGSNG